MMVGDMMTGMGDCSSFATPTMGGVRTLGIMDGVSACIEK
jgi:hypothetical protein